MKANCFTCSYLWSLVQEHLEGLDPSPESPSASAREIPVSRVKFRRDEEMTLRMIWSTGKESIHARFTAFPAGDHASAMNRKVDVNTYSTSAQPDLWCQWFRTCMESHEKCRQKQAQLQPFIPDRLIEVWERGTSKEYAWRLVRGADLGSMPYLTLSHCWGTAQPMRLMKGDNTYYHFHAASLLPQTYQDAFSIALTLGFRYLWIDSLCIVQDDELDWKSQSSVMGSIYENSACTIAATWARDGSEGCFIRRESSSINSPIIKLPSQGGQLIDHHILAIDSYLDDVTSAPMNSRGWVTQERFLSRRQFNFSRKEVYWECDELIASEHFPKGLPDELWDLTTLNQDTTPGGHHSLDFNDEPKLRQAWSALVGQYSDCEFSQNSDKFIALAGLANKIRDATGDEYVTGLWRKDLHRQLCWVPDIDSRFRFDRYTATTYVAPTWSWANAEGPVMYDLRYTAREEDSLSLSEVTDVVIQSDDQLNTHSFVSCKLFLRGIAVWAHVDPAGDRTKMETSSDYTLSSVSQVGDSAAARLIGPELTIEWDENCSLENLGTSRGQFILARQQERLLFMLIYIDDGPHVFGLVLRRVSQSPTPDNLFVRMGRFTDLNEEKLWGVMESRLKLPRQKWTKEGLDFDDERLSDLVQAVAIV
ncbi:unnamed protein product [Clonostachys chloroleuca]|uniref:Heterokaryon incompatibility domain-containing protein n=1 Tax=Clonostachys chloroleuca TaxID=1926264 RepID=A0AA35LTU6_9HYPO|nr:unnamed protein product [Clonostachys chloroleuca]